VRVCVCVWGLVTEMEKNRKKITKRHKAASKQCNFFF
jgi:hypothetical protein